MTLAFVSSNLAIPATKEGELCSPSFVAGAAQSLKIDLQAACGLERVLNLAASPFKRAFFDSEVFRNFVDAFWAFRVCRQIRTGEMLEMFTKLWYNDVRKVV